MKHSKIYSFGDVVIVPFPFTDQEATKRRPAVVLSSADGFNRRIGQSVMAMITTKNMGSWPFDVTLTDVDHAGLHLACTIRMKVFTLDHRLIINKLGSLSAYDKKCLKQAITDLFELST